MRPDRDKAADVLGEAARVWVARSGREGGDLRPAWKTFLTAALDYACAEGWNPPGEPKPVPAPAEADEATAAILRELDAARDMVQLVRALPADSRARVLAIADSFARKLAEQDSRAVQRGIGEALVPSGLCRTCAHEMERHGRGRGIGGCDIGGCACTSFYGMVP